LLETLREYITLERKLLLQKGMSGGAEQPRNNTNTVISLSSSSNHSEQDLPLPLPALPIMAAPTVHPLPFPGTLGAPLAFNGRNVTLFLEKYESMCDNVGIGAETKARRIPEYCEDDVARELKGFDVWKVRDWEGLKTEMLKEWRKEDTEQLMYTRALLEEYVAKSREREGLKQYYRQFDRISKVLQDNDKLDAYSRGRLFVLGLPEDVRRRVLSKDDIGPEAETGTVNYEKALKIVKGIVAADERMEGFFMHPERRTEITDLATTLNEPKLALGGEPTKDAESSRRDKAQKDTQVDTVAALTKSFEALALPLTSAINHLATAATKPSEKLSDVPQGTRLDPALDRRSGNRYGQYRDGGRRWTCFMCEEEGHTLPRCPHTNRLMDEGKIHLNARNQVCLGPVQDKEMAPVFRQSNMTLLETVEKLLKMRDPNPPSAGVNFVGIEFDSDSDLEEGDITHRPISAEAFAARADVHQGKRPAARPDVTDPVQDPRTRATKQILKRQEKYPVMKGPRTGTYVQLEGESSGTVQEQEREATVVSDEPMEDAITVQPAAPAKAAKEKTPKTNLKKMLAGRTDPKSLVERMLDQTTSITWAELISLSSDFRRILFGSFDDPNVDASRPIEAQANSVDAQVEMNDDFADERSRQDSAPLYMAACPTAPVKINGQDVPALVDSGAEVSVMSSDLAKKLGLPISHTFIVTMSGATGANKRFIGLCEDVPIDINRVVHKAAIWVIHRLEHGLVLGRPFHKQAKLRLQEMPRGGTEATIFTPDGTGMVTWVAAQAHEERDQTKHDLQARQALNWPAGP
jgi:hypothetical protein